MNSGQVEQRGLLKAAPPGRRGLDAVVPQPVKFSDRPDGPVAPAPQLGEHTVQVLRTVLHLGEAELVALRAAGVIAGGEAI
jgi:crotonobetainyl-CoA:carnitine CoA-transferase CaiB-like acyl-CoA transferase